MTRRGRGRPPYPDILTPAEQRMLEELRKGGTNAEIAVRLGVSPDAVKYHISNMLGKLDLADRHALAAWRPGRERRRWLGIGVPASLAVVGRPLLWGGVGLGVIAVVAAVAVVLAALLEGDEGTGPLVLDPGLTATPPSTPATGPTATPAPATGPPPPSDPAVQLFPYGEAMCAVRESGALICWSILMGEPPLPAGSYRSAAGGWSHVCGIRESGEIACGGGYNDYGETDAPPGTYRAVGVGA